MCWIGWDVTTKEQLVGCLISKHDTDEVKWWCHAWHREWVGGDTESKVTDIP